MSHRYRVLLTTLATLAIHCNAADSNPQELEVALANSLQTRPNLIVSARLRLGQRYRPGCAIPMQILLVNSGAARHVDVAITQSPSGLSGADTGIRTVVMSDQALMPGKRQSQVVCVRAPDILANLDVLVSESGPTGTVLFKGALKSVLQPLSDETRVVLCCGEHSAEGLPKDFNHVISVGPKNLPDRPWMYESIDLVILSDDSFKNASLEALDALRNWLAGGGRLFLTSAGAGAGGALKAAIAANLLPVPPDSLRGAARLTDFRWWETNAGLNSTDVLSRKSNKQPVYVAAPFGFGRVVFLFPGNDNDPDAARLGLSALNDPALEHPREKLADYRVQPKACDAAVHRIMSPARMRTAGNWFGIGALIFCGVLGACCSIRSRLEAIGWVVCITAILAVMLNSFFPEPHRVVSRVTWTQTSADGRASVRREWSQVEAFRHDEQINAVGPAGGSFLPVYRDRDRLGEAQFTATADEDRLQLEDFWISTGAPALLLGSRVDDRGGAQHAAAVTLKNSESKNAFNCYPPPNAISAGVALWVEASGRHRFIEHLDSPEGFTTAKINDEAAAIRATTGSAGGPDVVSARVAMLNQAIRAATAAGQDTLIVWSNGNDKAGEAESLVQLSTEAAEPPAEEGARFALWSIAAVKQR